MLERIENVEILEPGERTLDELAADIKASHKAAGRSVAQALHHAIAAGDSLNEAFVLVKHGTWDTWCRESVGIHPQTANKYRRISKNKHLLPLEITEAKPHGGYMDGSVGKALHYLKEINAPGLSVGSTRRGKLVYAEARRLRDVGGLTRQQIADLLGVSKATIDVALLPPEKYKAHVAKRRREAKAKAAALRRERNRTSLAATSDDLGEAYSLIRKAQQRLQTALGASVDSDQRRSISAALLRISEAEDFVVKASKGRP